MPERKDKDLVALVAHVPVPDIAELAPKADCADDQRDRRCELKNDQGTAQASAFGYRDARTLEGGNRLEGRDEKSWIAPRDRSDGRGK